MSAHNLQMSRAYWLLRAMKPAASRQTAAQSRSRRIHAAMALTSASLRHAVEQSSHASAQALHAFRQLSNRVSMRTSSTTLACKTPATRRPPRAHVAGQRIGRTGHASKPHSQSDHSTLRRSSAYANDGRIVDHGVTSDAPCRLAVRLARRWRGERLNVMLLLLLAGLTHATRSFSADEEPGSSGTSLAFG